MDTGGRPMSMTIEQAMAHASDEYGFAVGVVEVDDIPNAEVHERLGRPTNWGGKPPGRPHVDYNAPQRLFPPGRPSPSLKDAQNRMVDAYRMLFETERALRSFIDMPLSNHYKTKRWLLSAYKDEKYQATISERKQEDRHAWLDVIDDSETRFLDFDHLRQLISANQSVFSGLLPDVPQFVRLLRGMKDIRNRIGHVNVLSEDDCDDFQRMCRRVLAIIQPQARR
jgi:hypothetical protein